MNVALYARYSTDNQSASSIDDQFRVCRELITREGWTESAAHYDREISGSITDRPGYQALLTDVRAGLVGVIVVEEVSRLWRAQAEQWRCVEELQYLGVQVIGVRDGIDTRRDGFELLLAVQGAMNARMRRECAWRTHRGLTGKIERGLCAGGVPYGYRTVEHPDGRALEIVEAQAEIVREIFLNYSSGMSCKAIAYDLNTRNIPSPRGSSWAVSAIYGSPQKGTGVLNNELYQGRLIWNRTRWVQQPGSQKRTRIERPQNEWQIQELPHLRIIEPDLWAAVRARFGRTRLDGGNRGKGNRITTLLSGLLRCGVCGGPVTSINAHSYGCSIHMNRGPAVCDQRHGVNRDRADAEILAVVRERLAQPDVVDDLKRLVLEELRQARAERSTDSNAARRRLVELDREIRNLIDAIATVGLSTALHTRLRAAEAERDQLQACLRAPERIAVPDMVPRLLDRYREAMAGLPALARRAPDAARQTLRDLIGDAYLIRDGQQMAIDLGDPADGVLRILIGNSTSVGLVAGVGFGSHRRIIHRFVRAA